MRRDRSLARLAALVAGDLVARIGALAAVIVASRWLGPAAYGTFAWGFAAGSIAAAFTEAGLTNHVMREAAVGRGVNSLVSATVRLRLLLTVCAVTATALIAWFATRNPPAVLTGVLLSAALSLRWVGQSHVSALLGLGDARAGLWQQGGERLLLLAALPALLAIRPRPDSAALAFALAAAGGWAISAWLWRRVPDSTRHDAEPQTLVRVVRDAWPLTIASGAVTTFLFAGPIVLGASAPAAEAGWYGAALNLYLPLVGVPAMIMKSVIGELAGSAPGPAARQAVGRLAFGAVAVPGVLALAAPEVTNVLFGAAYAETAGILRLLACGAAASWLSSFFYYTLLARHRERSYAIAVVASCGASLALLPFLVRAAGARGAALALVAAEVASLGITALLARDAVLFHPLRLLRYALRPALGALLPAGAAATALLMARQAEWPATATLATAIGTALVAAVPVLRPLAARAA